MTRAEDYPAELERLLAEAREAGALEGLLPLLETALDEARRARSYVAPEIDVPMRFGMVGESPKMQAVFDLIERVAPSEVSVLVGGETGTGKELVARALHEHSRRRAKPLLAENCAAVPATLLESELFGHKKGSFTGAVADRPGHFAAADGGTVFLDEIGDMPLEMQAKLLRVLETGELRPVGENKTIKVDVRLVAASNKDLAAMVAEKQFREDLFYRLNVISIHLPALRERNGDIAHLVRYFRAKCAAEDGAPAAEIDEDALAALCAYSWPGNVRQLENEIRRATALGSGRIERAGLSPEVRGNED